jgi:uncharacterized delta-60 repeat protein
MLRSIDYLPPAFPMKKACLFLASVLGLFHLSAAPAAAQVYGVGDLPGGAVYSEVRDATRVGGGIHAVGGSAATGQGISDTAFLWKSTTGITAIPNAVTNTVAANFLSASAITPDGAYIASRTRTHATNTLRQATRVTTTGLTHLSFGGVGGFNSYSAAVGISTDGAVLLGFGIEPTVGEFRTLRFTAAGPAITTLPVLNPGDNESFPAARGISADGNVIVGNSYVFATTQGLHSAPGNHAFRYVHSTATMTPLPKLINGTWNSPLAVSPNGNLTLLVGNSALYPAGAVYLHNATNGAITVLGSPNAPWSPTNVGGMTPDGSVVVVTFGSNEATSTSQYTYFRNAHGWFHLKAAVAALPGSNAADWDFGAVFGISADGTLVFGSGNHNGVTEGYVIDLPAGYLANYNPAPVAPAQSSIVGTWTLGDTTAAGAAVVTFLADGTYFHIQTATTQEIADGGANGFERGRYYWNPVNGDFRVVTLQDTNGDIGLSGMNGEGGNTLSVSGDTLTIIPAGEGPVGLARVTPVANTLTGGWAIDDGGTTTQTVAIFLSNGVYFIADDGVPELNDGGPGIERGTYTWNAATGAFTATTLVDTNGQWGLSHPQPPTTVALAGNAQSFVFSDGGELTTVNRITAPAAGVTSIATQPQNITVTSGSPATFTVTATSTGTLSYQWRRNGFVIPGATAATYTIPTATRADADYYDVVVSDGTAGLTSQTVRLSVAPTSYATLVAPDATRDLQPERFGFWVHAFAELANGDFYVAGNFIKVDGARRTMVYRVTAAGAVDTTYTPAEIDGTVRALVTQPDGKLVIAGDFVRVGGVMSNRLARLNADGSVDLEFSSGGGIGFATTAYGLVRQSDGKLLVTTNGGNSFLMRFNVDGTRDTAYAPTLNNQITSQVLQADGKLVVGGHFTTVNGVTRGRIARLNVDGTLDTSFASGTAFNEAVLSLAVAGDGGVYVGGYFTTFGGVAASTFVKLDSTAGALAPSFTPPSFNGYALAMSVRASDGLLALVGNNLLPGKNLVLLTPTGAVSAIDPVQPNSQTMAARFAADGRLLIGGYFGMVGAANRTGVARLNTDGTVDASLNHALRQKGVIAGAMPLPNGQTLVVGSFHFLRGVDVPDGVARINADGSVDATFNPGGSGSNGWRTWAAVRQPDGRILIAGEHSQYNGVQRTYIARLLENGALDPSFVPPILNGTVRTVQLLPGGRVLIGGDFTTIGSASRNRVAVLTSTGALDLSFDPGTGFNNTVVASAVQADGKVVLTGNFTTANNQARNYLARLNANGSLDATFNIGTGLNSAATNLSLQPDGKIYVSGYFSSYNGVNRSGIVRLNGDGTLDTAFSALSVSAIQTFVVQEDGKPVIAGGWSFPLASVPGTAYLARLTDTGAVDPTFVSGGMVPFNQAPTLLTLRDNGQFVVSTDLMGMIATQASAAPLITTPPASQTSGLGADVTFSVTANSALPTFYQWYFNNIAIPGARGSSYTITNAQPTNVGSYTVTVTNELGSVTSAAATLAGSGSAPTIATQPTNVTATLGQSATFSVTATGSGSLTYQWLRNGMVIPGATAATYTIPAVAQTDADYYGVAVSAGLVTTMSANARLSVALPTYPAAMKVDPAYTHAVENNFGYIYAMLPLPGGKFIVAGDFTRVNGASKMRLAQYNADGSLDTSFNSPNINFSVRAIARQTDGKLIIAGDFNTVSNQPRNRIARLNADGSLDTSFNLPNGPNSTVYTLQIQSDGKILITGGFTSIGGVARTGVARLNADATVDTGYNPVIATNPQVYAARLLADGRLAIAGTFATVGGVSRNGIAVLTTGGALDTSFDPGSGFSGTVRSVAQTATNQLLVAGSISAYNGNTSVRAVVRLDLTGALDATFSAGTGQSSGTSLVSTVLPLSDGGALVGGNFGLFNGSTRVSLVRLTNTGAVDPSFTVGTNANATVECLAFDTNGGVLVGGNFIQLGGQDRGRFARLNSAFGLAAAPTPVLLTSASPNTFLRLVGGKILVLGNIQMVDGAPFSQGVMRLNADGTPDLTFNVGAAGVNSPGGINRMAALPDGRAYLVGSFSSYNGASRFGIVRINADGSVDPTFTTGTSAAISALALAPGGKPLLAGSFTSFNGVSRNSIVRLNLDGTVDSSFASATSLAALLAVAVLPDGKILVGGSFTSYNGVSLNRLARLNADGTLDSTWTPGTSGANSNVNAIVVAPDGKIYIGGDFTSYSGTTRNRVARLNADGTLDTTWGTTTSGATNSVQGLQLQADGKLIARGFFTGLNGSTITTAQRSVARFNADGSSDDTFGIYGTANVGVNDFITLDDGRVMLATNVASLNDGTYRLGLARATATSLTAITAPPTAQVADLGQSATFSVTATGDGNTYQWFRNGVAIPGATAASYTVPSATLADFASYTVTIASAFNSVTSPAVGLSPAQPLILDQPVARRAVAGGVAELNLSVVGSVPLTVEWRKNGVPVTLSPNVVVETTNVSGGIASALIFESVTAGDADTYTAHVSNAAGSATSNAAVLTVVAPENRFWQQFTEWSANQAPNRSFHDGNGGVYFSWTTASSTPDMLAGRFVGPIARLSESTGAHDPAFALAPRLAFSNAAAPQPDGTVLVAGSVGDAYVVRRFSATGAHDPAYVSPIFGRAIRFLTRQANGKLLVAATDNLLVNAPATSLALEAPTIYRLNADGSLDTGFAPAVLGVGSVLYGAPMADASGRVYLAGSFASVSTVARTNIARLNSDGTVDSSFVAPAGFISSQARGVAFQSDGRAVFVGDFRYTGRGTSADPVVAIRFNTDGTFDTTFAQPLRSEANLTAGLRLRYLVIEANDTIVGVSNRLVRFTANGAVDPTFASSSFQSEGFWLSKGADGRLYLANQFAVNRQRVPLSLTGVGVATFAANGTLDPSFQTGGWGQAQFPATHRVLSDGRVWLSGNFNRYGATPLPGIVQLDGTGALTATQPARPSTINPGSSLPFADVAPASGDLSYVIWGDNASPAFAQLRRLQADGSIDGTFSPVLPTNYSIGFSNMSAAPGGKLILSQTSVTAQAALNGATGDSMFRLNADGSRDTSYTANLSSFAVVERDAGGFVTMIRTGGLQVGHVAADGRALVVVSAIDGSLKLQRLLANGALDDTIIPSTGFTTNITDPVKNVTQQFPSTTYSSTNLIRATVQLPNGKVYVGGRFALPGSPTGLVRLNSDGSLDATFTGAGIANNAEPLAGPYVSSFAVDAAGRVYVAGRFDSFNGVAVPGLFRLTPAGVLDTAWAPGLRVMDYPAASVSLSVAHGKLYVAGTVGGPADVYPTGGIKVIDISAGQPTITAQPANLTVTSGQNATLSVTFSEPTGATYQWRRNGVAIAGATSATYTIPGATRASADRYDVVITTATGATFTSTPAVLSVAPTAYPGRVAYDASFAPDLLSISTRIYTTISLPDGKWLVGGDFVRWDNQVRTFLVRLNADYSVDTGFVPPQLDGTVYALARASDGALYVGGEFGYVNRHATEGLIRLAPNGTLDLAWEARDPGARAAVTALAVQPDGKLLVARQNSFSGFSGQVTTAGTNVLRRLNVDGSHDTTFSVDLTVNGNRLYNIVVEPSGAIAFSGFFTAVNGTTRGSLARVSSTGELDNAFGGSAGANSSVFTLARQSDGRYLIAGFFGQVAGVARNRAAILNADGSLDTTFVAPTLSGGGNIIGATMLADGRVLVAGTFTTIGGQASYGLARLTATGAVDGTYTAGGVASSFASVTQSRGINIFPQADGSIALFGAFQAAFNQRRIGLAVVAADGSLAATPNASVYRPAFTGSAYPLPGNQTVVFGSIDTANGATGPLYQTVRLNDNGSVDATYPEGTGYNLNGLSTFGIYRAVRQSDGKYLAVGDLVSYNGNARTRMVRTNADGTFDPTFNAGTGPSIVFPQMLPLTGGRTLMGGFGFGFTFNGAAATGLLRLNADGTRDTTFAVGAFAPSTTPSIPVSNLAEQADGKVIVFGSFTSYAGTAVPGLMRLNVSGSLDSTFNVGTGANGFISQAHVLADGRILLVGGFTTYNDQPANRVAIVHPSGALDTTFTAAAAINATVVSALPQENGKFILIGDFTGTPVPNAARLNADGTLDDTFALQGLTGGVTNARIFMGDDGTIYIHNGIISLNYGVPVAFARFRGAAVAPTVATPPASLNAEGGTAQFLAVTANGTGPFTYQWFRNGEAIDGATGSVLRFPSISTANAGNYTVTVTNAAGSVNSSVATVTVSGAPLIVDQPFGRKVPAGSRVLFRVTATGSAPFTYEWRRNGTPVPNGNAADLTLSGVTSANTGNYTVIVTNAQGSVESAVAALEVVTPDNVLWQQFNEFSTENSPARLFSDGAGKLYVPWTVNDRSPDMAAGKYVGALARFDEATGAYDPTFKLPARYRRVMHMATQPDGKLILAVTFGDSATVIRVDATGAVDSTFTAPFFARSVRFITRQPDGKILVAAVDVLAANAPAGSLAATTPQLHRLSADGSLDATFTPANIGGNGILFAAPIVDGTGRIYLAGSFNAINGTARTNVARLAADGSLDATYAAALPSIGFVSTQARGIDFQSDGRAVFVGDFRYNARGTSADPIQAIRFNTDGSFDYTFAQPLRSQLGLNAAVAARLRHVITLPDNKLVAVSTRLVRMNADGSVDTSFASRNLTREGFWVARGASGELYVPDQTSLASATGATTLPLWDAGIAKFSANGAPDFSFQTGGFGRVGYVNFGRVAADGSVWVSGAFNRFGPAYLPGVAHFSAPGTLAATQAATPAGANAAFINVPLAGVTAAADNKTYVISVVPTNSVGPFFAALRRLNADGTEDASFAPVLPANYNLGTSSPYTGAGGKLMLAQGSVAAQVALNGGAGDALIRLNLDGSRDTGYTPSLTSFASVERDASNVVTMIRTGGLNVAQVLADGRALIVVSAIDGNLRLIRLNADGTLDSTFNAPSFGTITPSSGFTSVGLTDPQNPTFVGQFPITTYSAADLIRTAVQMPDGKVYVGGRFALAGSPQGLVRLNADGSLDSTFTGAGLALTTPGSGPYVTALAADTSGRLYAAGRFTSFNGTAVNGLFRLKTDGTLDTAWAPSFSVVDAPTASVQLTVANDKLYAFGTVAVAASTVPPAYAVMDIPALPVITAQPLATNLPENGVVTLFVDATSTSAMTFQWYRDGVLMPNETFSSLSVQLGGTYTVAVTSSAGTVTSAPAVVTVVPSAPVFNPTGGNLFGTFNQVIPEGTSALIEPSPTAGTEPISYQWLFNGNEIPGATAPTYFLPEWRPQHAGAYAVRATNSLGTVTTPVDHFYVSPEGGWQWRNPAPTGNGLTNVTYLNGQFYAGGLRGTLLVSTDGLTWTQRAVPAANNIFGFEFVNGQYVAMASLNAMFVSPDGVVWTPRSTGINGGLTQLQDMTSGAGRIVAVGTGGVTSTSTDGGLTWTTSSIGATDTLFGATYVLNKFFAVSGTSGRVYSSADGITWNSTQTPAPTLRGMTYGAGRLVAVGDAGVIVTSSDGSNWTSAVSGTTNALTGVSFVNNLLIATGINGTILTSSDGVTWTPRSSNGNQSNLQNAAYGAGRYVIVGQGGNTGRTLLTSTDAITWTSQITGPYQGTHLFGVVSNGTTAVAVGNGGAITTSSDLAVWTARASGTSQNLADVAFGGGKFVAVGNGGAITVSTDAATWTAQSTSAPISTTGLLGVHFDGTQWIVVGNSGRIYTAPDALPFVWTSRTSTTSLQLRKVTTGAGTRVAVGQGGVIVSSTDGATWTTRTSGTNLFLLDVAHGNGAFVAVGSFGAVTRSTDGVTWSMVPRFTNSQMTSVRYSNGHFIATGPNHLYYTSTDGLTWTGRFTGAFDPLLDTVQHGNQIVGVGNFGTILTAGAPSILTPASFTVSTGQPATIKFAVAHSPFPVTYTWTRNGSALGTAPNSPILRVDSADASTAGTYRLTATNAFGSTVSQDVTVSLNVGISITTQPAPQTVVAGGSATFSVVATGTPAPTYQWRLGGVDIPNATGASVTLSNLLPIDSGLVTVVLTNAGGSVTSTPAQLTVNPVTPVITSPLAAFAVANVPFSYQIGTNQTTATFAATPLPAGLTVNATTGVIEGTPTQTGVFNLTISATNVTGSDSETLQLTVQPPAPIITSAASASGRVNVPFTYTITASNSPTDFLAFNLPPGVTRSGAVLSGTPTTAGFYSTNIVALNATGQNSRVLTIQIAPPLNAPVFTGSSTPSVIAGAAFNFTPNFGSGITNYTLVNLPSGAASVLPSGLTLNATTGAITGTTTQLGTFSVAVRATNADGATTQVLTFTVNPAPSAPAFTSSSSVTATVGTPFSFTLTTNPAATNFAALGLPSGLSLTGATISGTPTAPGISSVALSASNANGASGATLLITVNSAANAPVITSAPIANGRVNTAFNFALTATNAPTAFTVVTGTLPAGLTLDGATGAITGTPSAAGQSSVWVAASNPGSGRGPAAELVFIIERALNVPVITSNGTAAAQVGRAFQYQITATNTPTSFAASPLPDGLSLLAGGIISGIPSAETSQPIEIILSATNSDGTSAPKLLSLTIAAAPATPRITSSLFAGGRAGTAFTYQATATPTATSFSIDSLPTGLEFNSTTGLINGTPTVSGTFTAQIRAANADGLGRAETLTFTFAAPLTAPVISSEPTATGKVGVSFSYAIVASGTPTSYAVTGALPPGVTLNTTTGVIAGVPGDDPGLYEVTVTASNASGASQPQPLLIAIDPADNVPVITSATSATATVGGDFTYQITATNVPLTSPFPPSVFLDAVNLPPGLAVNPSTGVIQGRPSEAGTYLVILNGVNANGTGLPRALTITVNPSLTAPVVNSASNASAQVNVPFTYQITATNGPTSFEALDAPVWLTVNTATGQLSGTPTSPGSIAILLRAANAGGASNLAPLSLNIAAAPNTPVVSSVRTASGRVNSAFTYDVTATVPVGQPLPTSYKAFGLPPMLEINAANGQIRGTPTVSGTFNVTISATNANGEGQPVTLTITITPSIQVTPPAGG